MKEFREHCNYNVGITVSSKVWRLQGRNCEIMYTTAKNRQENNGSSLFDGKATRTKVEYVAILSIANISDQAEKGSNSFYFIPGIITSCHFA